MSGKIPMSPKTPMANRGTLPDIPGMPQRTAMPYAPSRRRTCVALAAVAVLPAGLARSQPAWPTRPVSLVVPFPAGGSSDFGARLIAPELAKRFDQPVVVENVGGAGGALGVQRVVRAAPDGYTLLYGSLSETVLVPMVNPKVGYASEELEPVALAGGAAVAFVARQDFPASTLDELIALARRRPGALTYGSPGVGTFQHVMAETVKARTGIFVVHIPYRGAQPMMTDLMGGAIDVGVTAVTNVPPLLKAGRVKVLGVTSSERIAALPSVPAFGDTPALRGLDLQTWAMVFAPRATPPAVVDRANAAIVEVLRLPAIVEAVLRTGSTPARPLDAAQARAFYARERDVYRPIASRIAPE